MALPRNTIIAIAAAVIVVAGGIGAYFWLKSPSDGTSGTPAAPQDDGPLPDPRVLLVSMEAVTQGTTVGQSIVAQMQELGNQARDELGAEAKALQTEEAAVAKLPPCGRVAPVAPVVRRELQRRLNNASSIGRSARSASLSSQVSTLRRKAIQSSGSPCSIAPPRTSPM